MWRTLGLSLFAVLFAATSARADLVEYAIPNTNLVVMLQGNTTVNPGGTVSFRHPRFGTLVFGLEDVQIHKVDTTQGLFQQKLRVATRSGDAEQLMEVADWALHHGLLAEFYDACREVLKLQPDHAVARHIVKLKQMMDQPISNTEAERQSLKQFIRKGDMRFEESAHFILLHDTSDKKQEHNRKTRAEERLELLEAVYESFLLKFYSKGIDLDIPKEKLMVVLFSERADYLNYSTTLAKEIKSTAGFYQPQANISVFYDQGTNDSQQAIKNLADQLQDLKAKALRGNAANTKDIVRMANTFSVLAELTRENADIEVVSHEATHHMASATGLLPRRVMVPSWAHEGLAAYFESPNDAAWSGIGAVNGTRLRWYRALAEDTKHSNISFITGDQIFAFAGNGASTMHAYGQGWALTHFLMEKHFDELMKYYRLLGGMPADTPLNQEVLMRLFDSCFTTDRDTLNAEWHSYMRGLQTDKEKILKGN